MNIIVFILALVIVLLLYRFIRLAATRTALYIRLRRLAKTKNFKLKFTRNPVLSLLKISHAPDITAEIGDKIYAIRLYNGAGKRHRVHFADQEYSARFRADCLSVMSDVGRAIMSKGRQDTSVGKSGRVIIIPSLVYSDGEKEIIPITVFNPAPSDITYVSEERSSIKRAFSGDEIYGTTVFSSRGVCDFLERKALN